MSDRLHDRLGANPSELLKAHLPCLEFRDVHLVEDGWDSLVLDVDDQWIVRFPRRAEVEEWMEREIALLPELSAVLPVEVPRFDLITHSNEVMCVAYRKIIGQSAADCLTEVGGGELGRVLSELHTFPVSRARALGIPYFDPPAWRKHFETVCGDFRERVFPLLHTTEQERATSVFERVSCLDFEPALIHNDLGPQHVLCRDGRVVGLIDWSDARIADPARDLAWCLNGTSSQVAAAVARGYHAESDLRERSLFYYQLGPWYEVTYGLETGQEQFVRSGVDGVRARLFSDLIPHRTR